MIVYIASILLTLILIFFIQSIFSTDTKHYPYRYRGLWFIYLPKWLWYSVTLKMRQLTILKRLNRYDRQARSYDYCGVVPSPFDVQLESPKTLITDRHADGILIWGGDAEGRMVVAKVVRHSKRRATIYVLVKDKEGNLYTLPNHPDTNTFNTANEEKWVGSGLYLECVEPMRTWRVKFNGLMRKGTRDHYITDDIDDDDDEDDDSEEDENYKDQKNKVDVDGKNKENTPKKPVIHVRFDFVWKAMRSPVDMWKNASCRLLADSLAREAYADWSNFRALQKEGYDQWGACHGTINMGKKEPQKWYLRGARQHRWGMSDCASNLQESLNLFSCFSSGDILSLEGFAFKSGISHLVMGYVQTASGFHYPVTSTSLEVSEICNQDVKNIFVSCSAGGKRYQLWWRLFEGISVYSGDPWTLKHELKPSHAVSNRFEDGWGLVIKTKRFTDLCPVPEKETYQLPLVPLKDDRDLLVVPIENHSSSETLTGGKGASLSILKYIEKRTDDPALEFFVPNGVAVTSRAWAKQTKSSPDLKNAVNQLEKSISSSSINKLKEESARVRSNIESMQVCDEIIQAIKDNLEQIYLDHAYVNKRFAVRSSACGEDSSEASSAGQNETILGCIWDENNLYGREVNVIRALLTCWSSQFSLRSVEYKRQRGQPINGGMAVIIQEMVEAEVAGVLFTRDPLNGSPEHIVVSVNYGLGESVVSASTEPDTVRVKRTWRNKLRIKSKSVGEKKSKVIMLDSGGSSEVKTSENESQTFCLSDEAALKLAKLGIYIENYYGSPRDIEFAICGGKIYLLQARPITFLEEWTEYELTHELDTAFISDREICTIGNIAEVLNGYISPLTISTIVKMLDLSIQCSFVKREWPSYTFDPFFNKNVVVSYGHILLNIGEIVYRGVESKITMVIRAVDLCICGRLFTTEDIHHWAIRRFGMMNFFQNFIRTSYSFYDILVNARRVKRAAPIYSSYDIITRRITSASDLYKEISSRVPDLSKICEVHCCVSSASTLTQCIALVTLAQEAGEVNSAMIQDMASLLSCISETESAEVPTSMKALAKTISENDEAEEFLQMTPDEGKVWLESHPEEVGEVFRYFLYKHGHRCIKEFDLRRQSWGMAPETLVAILQTMVRNPEGLVSSKEKQNLNKIFDNLNSPISSSKRRALKFILKLCGTAVNSRESTKSMVIKTVDAFRKAYRTLGQLMVLEGRLPDADLIFFLQHFEVGVLLETRSVTLVNKAIRRKKLMSTIEGMEFDEVNFGVPTPINKSIEEKDDGTSSDIIRGTPVCNGFATGTARVVTSFQQASTIQSGDILITFCTDVGWTPYFPLLAGVVTEIGGLISHGAVVAREYGLPCVVGAKGATTKFKSGDRIIINGKEGYIKKH